jgi:hypothetical protein
VFCVELAGAYGLKPYEGKILARLSGITIPPVSIVRSGKTTLLYDTDGMKPLTELTFGDMSELFFVLRTLLCRYRAARENLLQVSKFFSAPEFVFVRMGSGEAYPIFGNAAQTPVSGASAAAQILPVIEELARHTRVPGAKGAIAELEKRVRELNPGFDGIMNIAEDVEREWNGILPSISS